MHMHYHMLLKFSMRDVRVLKGNPGNMSKNKYLRSFMKAATMYTGVHVLRHKLHSHFRFPRQ